MWHTQQAGTTYINRQTCPMVGQLQKNYRTNQGIIYFTGT